MATLTLAEWGLEQKEPLAKGFSLGIAQESLVADILSFRSTNALSETGVRYDEVIEPDWIPLDGTIASKTARGKQIAWGVSEMSVHVDVPVMTEEAGNVLAKPSTRQSMLVMKGSAYKMNDTFINGDQGTDPYGFNGIEKIVGNLGSGQTVGATEIDVSDYGTQAERFSVIDRLNEAIDACEGHMPSFALCNNTFGQIVRGILMRENLLGDNHNWATEGFPFGTARQTVRSAATRPLFVWQDIPFYDIGFKADQSTKIIGNAYAEAGSAGATRVYLVKMAADDLEGIQFSPPDMREIGMLEAKNNYRHRFTWRPGIAVWGPRSIVKMQGVKVA